MCGEKIKYQGLFLPPRYYGNSFNTTTIGEKQMKYILKGKKAVACDDITEWATWSHAADRVVKKTITGDIKVSTVFLGIDHSFGGGEVELFETMIFGGEHDEWMDRYSTWEQAEKGHEVACKMVG